MIIKLIRMSLLSTVILGAISSFSNSYAVDNNAVMDLYKQMQALGKEVDELRGENEQLKYQVRSMKTKQKKGFIAIDDRLNAIYNKGAQVSYQSTSSKSKKSINKKKSTIKKPKILTAQQKAEMAKKKMLAVQIARKKIALKALHQKRFLSQKRQQEWDSKQQAAILKLQSELNALKNPSKSTYSSKSRAVHKQNKQVSKVIQERKAYYAAYAVLKKNKYKAIKLFGDFITRYPKSAFLHKAHYWRGESYYHVKNYKSAVNEYVYVLNKYKSSPLGSDAALKLGMSLYYLQDLELAKETFADIVKFFPNTKAAKIAAKRLKAL